MNPVRNKGAEGGKSRLYLLSINQVKRMINKCRFLLQYFKNSVNNLPPSSLSQPRSKGLKLDSWLRRAAGRTKYINPACNEEHGYICALMNLGARGGWVTNVFRIDLLVQPLLPSVSEWLKLITGALWERRLLGTEVGTFFLVFFSPGWKRLSSFLDSNLFASKMGWLMPISPFTSHQEMCSKTTLKGSPCPSKPLLRVFYP